MNVIAHIKVRKPHPECWQPLPIGCDCGLLLAASHDAKLCNDTDPDPFRYDIQ